MLSIDLPVCRSFHGLVDRFIGLTVNSWVCRSIYWFVGRFTGFLHRTVSIESLTMDACRSNPYPPNQLMLKPTDQKMTFLWTTLPWTSYLCAGKKFPRHPCDWERSILTFLIGFPLKDNWNSRYIDEISLDNLYQGCLKNNPYEKNFNMTSL